MGSTEHPSVALSHLDHLWFQVSGTLCNFTCHHCFISCSPHNRSFGFLSLDVVRVRLIEATALGVKEFYFTGGEPFLNPEMTSILELALQFGPATVLTNATVLKDEWLTRMRRAEEAGCYSLEFRVSLDGPTSEINDPIRGDGTFVRTMKGIEKLVAFGFLPIITITRTWPDAMEHSMIADFVKAMHSIGYTRPRLKILPALRIGAEEERTCGYRHDERVSHEMMDGFDEGLLVCTTSRIVTDRGVHVCPILIAAPESLLGTTLADSMQPFELKHGACLTCYQYGSICSNASSSRTRGAVV